MGTLLDEWDTEKHHIFVNSKEVKISKIEDLFPYLWRNAGCTTGVADGNRNYFFSSKEESYWWDRYETERIERLVYYAKAYARKHGKNTDLVKTEYHWMSAEDYAVLKKVYEIVRLHPFKRKYDIPNTIKSSMTLFYEGRLKENKRQLKEDNP